MQEHLLKVFVVWVAAAVMVVGETTVEDELGRRIDALELEAGMLPLLNSRLKALESDQHLLNQELMSVRRDARRCKREVETLRQELLQHEALTVDPACCLSLNETLLQAEEKEHEVNATLRDLSQQLHNFSLDLHGLQQRTRHQPLLLCPTPYTKVDGQCLYLLTGRRTWEEARAECEEQGAAVGGHGNLVTPTNVTAFRAHIQTLQTDSSYLWVGGVREGGRWRWVSRPGSERGESDMGDLMGLPWDIGEPDNTHDQRFLCIHSVGSIKFHDCTNAAMLSAVCQVT